MGYFTVYKHNDNLYQIKDALGSLSTILIGSKKALVLDTCYGIENLYEEVRKITSLPLIVVNSHGHMDHSSGNYQFEEVYIHSKDVELAKLHNSKEWRKRNIESVKRINNVPLNFGEENYLKQNEGNLLLIDDIKEISLGNKTLEVIYTPGHTNGSISLYCKEDKLMIVSDAICQYVWLFLDESTSVSKYIESVKKVLEYDFDYFLVGHGPKLIPKETMKEYLDCATHIDLNKIKKADFANFSNPNSYSYCTDYLYSPKGCGVVFDITKM